MVNPKCPVCGGPTILLLTSFVCAWECDLTPPPKTVIRHEPEMDIEITEEIPIDWKDFGVGHST